MYTTYMGTFWGKTLWLVVCVVCGVVYVMMFLVCLHWPWDRFQCLPCLYSFISKHEGLMKGTLKHDKHLDLLHYHINVKLEKYLQSDVQVTFEFMVISHVYMSFIPNETTFTKHCLNHRELWNLLSKAVPDKFHRSDRHSKCICLQDGANFYRSWACQIPTFGIRARATLSCVGGRNAGGYGCNSRVLCRPLCIVWHMYIDSY